MKLVDLHQRCATVRHTMAKEAHIALRIEAEQLKRLQKLGKSHDRPVSWLIRKAIEDLLRKEGVR
jgi:predicted DNA-binding protein